MRRDTTAGVIHPLEELRDRLRSSKLLLESSDAPARRRVRDELVGQIDDYMLPRLREADAPLLTVVGGSTGAGKSTLVNSLVGREVSPAGVIRPTTRSPALVCHPEDVGWFSGDRILPSLSRSTGGASTDLATLHLVPNGAVPRGLALLDAPDIDSVVTENRELAVQLLAAADLWLFVTTAARYADAVPWDLLRTARSRSTALAIVLNRLPEEAVGDVPLHLSSLLEREGLGGTPVFVVAESELTDGIIPPSAIGPLREWLDRLGADADARAATVRTTLNGALDSLVDRVEEVVAGMQAQAEVARALEAEVNRAYGRAGEDLDDALRGGTLLRGEVLARWHEFIGTGEWMRNLETRMGQLRDRLREVFTGRPAGTEVRVALGNSIETLVVSSADRAAEQVADAWEATPAGRALLGAEIRRLSRSSERLAREAEAHVRAWQGHVLELVSAEGAGKRTTGRALSFGVNSLGVALMVAVFAHTGGLTGGELVVAGGTATLSQKVLEALFGDQAVRELTARARSDLLTRIDSLLREETKRFRAMLRSVEPRPGEAAGLREAARAVQSARA